MDEKTLLKIALIGSLIGILLIMFVEEKVGVQDAVIASLSKDSIDQEISLKGKISSLRNTPAVVLFDIVDKSGKIKVVAFKENNISLKLDDVVEVSGTIIEFKNSLELEAKTIKVF
jgi:RecJ-like exonuclease|tara:strand:+ start:17783 stop:18130 length:348 start_codon:yes stop_codon:yes gene_type:complete